MRGRGRRLVAVTAGTLLTAAPASAHVVVTPAFLVSGATTTISLAVPNERAAPMTGLAVTVPDGIEIEEALEPDGWDVTVEGAKVTWSGGSLRSNLEETFGLRITANVEPGTAELEAEQLYRDGRVRWPAVLTIVPGSSTVVAESGSGSDTAAAALAAVGLVVAAIVAVLAWRRRAGSLQER